MPSPEAVAKTDLPPPPPSPGSHRRCGIADRVPAALEHAGRTVARAGQSIAEHTYGKPVSGEPPTRVRAEAVNETDRLITILMPVAAIVASGVIPFIMWLIWRGRSDFVDDHGRAIVDFLISMTLWMFISAITFVGLIFVLPLMIVTFVSLIRGALAASRDEYFRYPMTIRLLS